MSNELVSALSLMPETKREQDIFVDKLVESVKQGAISPLKAEAIICNLEQVAKAYRANAEVKDMLLQAVQFKGENAKILTQNFKLRKLVWFMIMKTPKRGVI